MGRRVVIVACALLPFWQVPANAQGYSPEQLQALIAPIALYPDALVFEVLGAASHPDDVRAAAANPGAEDPAWDRSVRGLAGYPELLERMAENPAWLRDLGEAASRQRGDLMQALETMRALARDAGTANDVQSGAFVYYDPVVAYGRWRPAYPLPQWRQWHARGRPGGERGRGEVPRNGPPSKAAQMQSEQPQIGARGNGGPSPALQLEQKR